MHLISFFFPDLLYDNDFMMEAIKRNAGTFRYARGSIRENRELALQSVKRCPALLGSLVDFRQDKSFVCEVVRFNRHALMHIGYPLSCDPDVLLSAKQRR